jgi:hypothetical protein
MVTLKFSFSMSRREVNGDNMNTTKALPSVLTLWIHTTRSAGSLAPRAPPQHRALWAPRLAPAQRSHNYCVCLAPDPDRAATTPRKK